MGRSRNENEIIELKNAFKQLKDKIYFLGKFEPRSSNVWVQLQKLLSFNVSTLSLCTMTTKNYYNLWNEIFEKTDLKSDVSINDESGSEKSLYSSPSDDGSVITEDVLNFTIQLSHDEYTVIKPKTKQYCNSNKTREYLVFAPNVWTSLIYRKFVETTKLGCVLNFKRAKGYGPDAKNFANITGYCNECKSVLKGMYHFSLLFL